jgi:tetraacyldisaccharide 4'-kinase
MGVLWPDWGRIHHGESPGFWSPLLTVFSILYGAAVRFRVTIYKRRGFKKKILPGFVVSIGNLTAGGTGKTPAVVMLARWALNQGYRVAVLTRGYGRLSKAKVLEVSDGEVIKADCRESGDEPYLLAKKLTGVPVIISSKRFTAGTFAHRKFGANFFILDDGFQHLGLKRDLDLVLIDAIRPFGNGHLLPWGPLREPIDQLARAGALILTRFSNQNSTQRTTYLLKSRFFMQITNRKELYSHS